MSISTDERRPPDSLSLGLYNYGHFTSMLVTEGRVKGLDLHWQRLRQDCETLFGVDLDIDVAQRAVCDALGVGANPSVSAVRLTVFDPGLDLGRPEAATTPAVLATTRPGPARPGLSPLSVRTVVYERDLPQVKHVGLFAALSHRRAARLAGFDDALFVDRAGMASEGATWNLVCLDERHLIWPHAAMLPGVTATLIADLARDLGISHITRPVSVTELSTMTAAYALNSIIGIREIAMIDNSLLPGNQELMIRLHAGYESIPGQVL